MKPKEIKKVENKNKPQIERGNWMNKIKTSNTDIKITEKKESLEDIEKYFFEQTQDISENNLKNEINKIDESNKIEIKEIENIKNKIHEEIFKNEENAKTKIENESNLTQKQNYEN